MCEKSRAFNTWANSVEMFFLLSSSHHRSIRLVSHPIELVANCKIENLIILECGKNQFHSKLKRNLLVNPDSSSENIKKPLFMSLVRGAKMLDVTFCGLERNIFAVDDCTLAFRPIVAGSPTDDSDDVVTAVDDSFCGFNSVFCENDGNENIAAVTDLGRRLTISQLFTLIVVLMGLIVILSPACMSPISFWLFAASTNTTLFLTSVVVFVSTFFGFKSLIPSTMLSLFITLFSDRSVPLFFIVPETLGSTAFDSSCCASSCAHESISCSFSIPLEVHNFF